MNVERIILSGQDKLTSEEKDFQLLHEIEKQLGTGPIISEAREALLFMSRNLQVRDMLLDAMGLTTELREKYFIEINSMLDLRDQKILAERKSTQVGAGH